MLQWLWGNPQSQGGSRALTDTARALWEGYQEKLLPLERDYDFAHHQSKELTEADFSARPMVLLLGQYSTGKTSLVKHLLGREYPGMRIGMEPTTEKFVAVMHGDNVHDTVIPGHMAASDSSMPFVQLGQFGDAFLNRFECAKFSSPVLEGVTLIDSPGVLAGEKQLQRGYDFEAVTKWFADRVDVILLLFDVSKLDISDELRRVIVSLAGNERKLRIILNKAGDVTTPDLMRVLSALTWSLGKIINSPEVARVYIGSFWQEPLQQNLELASFFASQENDLYMQLAQLPRSAAIHKLNELVRRARLVKAYVYLLAAVRNKMPTFAFWRQTLVQAQQELVDNLQETCEEVIREHNLPPGDLPNVASLKDSLSTVDVTKLPKWDEAKMQKLADLLTSDIQDILERIPEEQALAGHVPVAPRRRAQPQGRSSRSRSRSRHRSPVGGSPSANDAASSTGGGVK